MTLCIAWKRGPNVHLISDSRYSFPGGVKYDYGAKIMSVPVKFYEPHQEGEAPKSPVFDKTIGLCFAGNVINSFLTKEMVFEVGQHLQYIPRDASVNMELVCKIVNYFYKRISVKYAELISGTTSGDVMKEAIPAFILAGYCPERKVIRVFYFSPFVDAGGRLTTHFDELFVNNTFSNPFYIGSLAATKKAEELFNSRKHAAASPYYYVEPFYVLEEIIKMEDIGDVGGSIQYGCFGGGENFYAHTVEHLDVDENGHLQKYEHLFRGFEMNEGSFNREVGEGINISYSMYRPFIDKLKTGK